jgi:hypothetical protein
MAEWRNGGMAEWWNGGMAEGHNVRYKINQDTESCLLDEASLGLFLRKILIRFL